MNLKQAVKHTLEELMAGYLLSYGSDETLANDLAKQCVSDEDVDRCLAAMLEHLDEQTLETLIEFFQTDTYRNYVNALQSAHDTIFEKVKSTLITLHKQEGEA